MDDSSSRYYLSCYLNPPGSQAILAARHDHGIALWRRNDERIDLVRLWELERLSGQKHHAWPLYTTDRAEKFLNSLLATEDLTLSDMTAVWGTPGIGNSAPLNVPDGAEAFPLHSLSHLFSGLLLDSELFRTETIVAMAVDGAPDTVLDTRSPSAWYAGCLSRQGRLDFLPIESPGPLYTAASTIFATAPGTLMALTTASQATIDLDLEDAMKDLELRGGRITPWASAFEFVHELTALAEAQLQGKCSDSSFSPLDNVRSAVMKHVQRACEIVATRNVEALCALGDFRTEDAYLSTSGGFALNCPTNTMLMDRFGFRGLLTPPCANDAGQALGLGLLGFHGIAALDQTPILIDSPYVGSPLCDVDEAIAEFEPWIAAVEPFDDDTFVSDLSDGVVAWIDGPAEMGPRALGHRSLLGDPRSRAVKDQLNEYKQRQWWRPVAPIVLAEHTADWFEQSRPSPYMLEAVLVRPDKADLVPGIVHLDGTARHQTLTAATNPRLYRAIEAFGAATGVPIVCNTSLNDKGEPNVDTVAEALSFCVTKGIPILYVEGRRVTLRDEPVPAAKRPPGPRVRSVEWFSGQEADRDGMWDRLRELGYSDAGIILLTWSSDIRLKTKALPPQKVNELAEYYHANDANFASIAKTFLTDHGPGSYFVNGPGDLPKPVIVE